MSNRRKKTYIKQYIICIFIILISSCTPSYRISTRNYASDYNNYGESINPEYVLYNVNSDTTRLFFKVMLDELLHVRPAGEKNFSKGFYLRAEVLSSYESNTLIDSISFKYSDTISDRRIFISSLKLKIKNQGIFPVKITLKDLNRDVSSVSIINLSKTLEKSRNDFYVEDESGLPLFTTYPSKNQKFRIICNDINSKKLTVNVFKREFPVAPLPFANSKDKPFDFHADSTYELDLDNGISDYIQLPEEGIYHFQLNTTGHNGYTLVRLHDDFPRITLPEQMIYPLRYLTSRNEYNKIIIQKNKKEAVDEFWLGTAGNRVRAKELIRKFYNRVQDANKYFTSYLEGWKTDRGLIYIIYGNPNIVYKSSDAETWVYGEEYNMMSATFVFYKRENPFTDNDYILNRSPVFKDTWYNAVDVWRR